MPDDGAFEEHLPATPSQIRDAAELLVDELNYWRSCAARRKLRAELLSIRLAAAENVCELADIYMGSAPTPEIRRPLGAALTEWRQMTGEG